ncbi:hypothetical protein [Nocardia carnea]|uniref:hypothetical protein n=1 Tax=Nocardia carnea TaxID=37328 RepID=UPI0024539F15|nr:hypothetical protein [Nocardia carnea]
MSSDYSHPETFAADIALYLDTFFADRPGWAHGGLLRGEDDWHEGDGTRFKWPRDREKLTRWARIQQRHSNVYLCNQLMPGGKRGEHLAAKRLYPHADYDAEKLGEDVTPEQTETRLTELGAFGWYSGSEHNGVRNRHVFVELTESVGPWEFEALCKGLAAYIGAHDGKHKDNDVLRVPGTLNHKGDEPVPVVWFAERSSRKWTPDELAAFLGVDLAAALAAGLSPEPEPEPANVDLASEINDTLRAALDKVTDADSRTDDRSNLLYNIMAVGWQASLAKEVLRGYVHTRGDLGERADDAKDFERIWEKLSRTPNRADDEATNEMICGGGESDPVSPAVEPISLDAAHAVFAKWLGTDYDMAALDVVLAAAVERLDGDPLWVLLVSGPGNAKTETVQALGGSGAIVTSTISSIGALLSGTARKEVVRGATGGLLRKLEPRGVLVVKDVTSILSMPRETRGEVLAALREVYDGRWSRALGTDGGRTLEWIGRIAVVGAVTTAWDTHHAVVATMGDRFVLVRVDSGNPIARRAAAVMAAANTGRETDMRAELSSAAAAVLAGVDGSRIRDLSDEERDRLLAAADLVTLARTAVERDYQGDVVDAHAPEAPTRYAKQLQQVFRGSMALGMNRADAMALAMRCARDSVPPLRLAVLRDIAEHPDSPTQDVRKRIGKPRKTVDRELQALHMLGLLVCDEREYSADGRSRWFYSLADSRFAPDLLD